MTHAFSLAASALVLSATVALAAPQIPTPVNPFPDEPVATDGSPLPAHAVNRAWSAERVLSGRSVGFDASDASVR